MKQTLPIGGDDRVEVPATTIRVGCKSMARVGAPFAMQQMMNAVIVFQ
jgi:hypothetical protein